MVFELSHLCLLFKVTECSEPRKSYIIQHTSCCTCYIYLNRHFIIISCIYVTTYLYWFCGAVIFSSCFNQLIVMFYRVVTRNDHAICSIFGIICCRSFAAFLLSQFAIHWHHSSMMFRLLTSYTYHAKDDSTILIIYVGVCYTWE